MPALYIANPTRQMQRAYYRLEFTHNGDRIADTRSLKPAFHDIPSGGQVRVANRDLPMEAVEDIVRQLSEYGMLAVLDVERESLPFRQTVHYVFNVDKAVPAKIIERVFEHNQGTQYEAGKLLRQKAAVASAEIVAQATGDVQRSFAVEIEQEGENQFDTPPVAEGYRVDTQATKEDRPPPARRKKQ